MTEQMKLKWSCRCRVILNVENGNDAVKAKLPRPRPSLSFPLHSLLAVFFYL